jgi:hypothetical protein
MAEMVFSMQEALELMEALESGYYMLIDEIQYWRAAPALDEQTEIAIEEMELAFERLKWAKELIFLRMGDKTMH